MHHEGDAPATAQKRPSRLSQWPCQIKLAPEHAPYFDGCDLLIAADCTAYAYGNFHADFIRGRVTLIGCPKLDTADYEEKLTAILTENDVRSVMLTRMEVPCCGGLEYAARQAIAHSGRALPLRVVPISAEGRILQEQTTYAPSGRQTRPGPRRGQHRPSRGLFISKWILIIYFYIYQIRLDIPMRA